MRISKKKIISIIILFLLLIGLICGAVYLKKVADYKRAVGETTFGEIDVANVSDGIYIRRSGNKTHDRIREDTVSKNYPLYARNASRKH